MLSKLGQNNIDLQLVLEAINSLPEASPPEPEIPSIFGDGSDGVGLFTASTTWLADTEDTGMIVKNFESLIISDGVTVSAGNRNCGMIIRVKGDCTINGSIVNKLAPKSILDSDGVDFTAVYPASMLTTVAGNGGNGGAPTSSYMGVGGTGQTGRLYGGGYSGGGAGGKGRGAGGTGGSATDITTAVTSIFVGGAARSGDEYSSDGYPGAYGGGGGGCADAAGTSRIAGTVGGTGPGGNGQNGTSMGEAVSCGSGGAGNYGGGVVILLVGGNLVFSGTIDCSGSNGGNGGNHGNGTSTYSGNGSGSGGGGGGGGRIFICYKGTIDNTGTLNVNGGSGGAAGPYSLSSYKGGAGIAGGIGTTAVKTYEQYLEEDVA